AENVSENEDRHLLVGSELAKELADLTGMDSGVPLDIVSQEYIDMYGEDKLIDYLKSHYMVDTYAEYYKALARIKNLRVYSTNYDNLIEKVCNDCGNKIKGYSIGADIRKVNKTKMVMHLNGYIQEVENGVLPETFKLSHMSYNNTKFFDTPWYSYLIDELYSAKVIFIIGLSFSSDIDIRRLVADEELKDKIFFVERSDLSDSNRKFLDKYGRVLLCGVQAFLEDLAKIEVDEKRKKEVYYKTFRKANRYDNSIKPKDRDVYALLFNGIEKDGIYKKDANRCYEALVNRDKVAEVIQEIEQGKSVIIHSDLGNGKSVFVNQIVDLCPDLEFYYLKQINNQRVLSEIKSFCKDGKEKVLICDPANVYLDILSKFADFDLKNIKFILVMRSSMYDNYYNSIYDIIDRMSNVQFINSINLDELSDCEIELLDKLVLKYGFYGDLAGVSGQRRIEYLKKKCNSRFQNILIYLFESTHIIDRFVENIVNINGNSDLRRILILTFISGILELGLNTNDYKILLDLQDVERVIKRNKNCGELVDVERGKIVIKSSIIAKEL
ncbi:SIR2 family protein, partial [uncultured Clostridium sp.]|uniref:SIR2 family protein n=1 Tax=uncultured Clostridium sp. TaxID=59620 RepID=UPI0025D32DB9